MRDVPFLALCCVVLFASNDLQVSLGGRGVLAFSLFELSSYCLLVFLLMWVLPALRQRQHAAGVGGSAAKWLSLYLLWGLLVAVCSWGDPEYAIQIDYKKLLPGAITFAGVLLIVAGDQGKLRRLQTAWFAAGIANVGVALSQFCCSLVYFTKVPDEWSEKRDLAGDVVSRMVVGFGGSANAFAQIIIPWFVIPAIVWLTRKQLVTMRSVLWLVLSTLFGFVLLATACKGALLWSAVGIVLGVAMTKWSRWRAAWAPVLVTVAIILIVVGVAAYDGTSAGEGRGGTLQARMDLAVTAWHLLVDHPVHALVGGGRQYWSDYVYKWARWRFYDAHNVYLNQILLYGVIGVVLFGAFVRSCMKEGLRNSEGVQPGVGLVSPFPYVGAACAIGGEYWFEPSFKDAIQKHQLLFVLAMLLVVARGRHARADGAVG